MAAALSKTLRSFIVKQRMRFSLGYGLLASFGIGLLVASKLQDIIKSFYGVAVPLKVLLPLGILILWLTGLLYHKLGFWAAELELSWSNNPKAEAVTDDIERKRREQENHDGCD